MVWYFIGVYVLNRTSHGHLEIQNCLRKRRWTRKTLWMRAFKQQILIYYIDTNEIPGELSGKNMISSHEKITCDLHMWKDHCCFGYMKNK